jgi:hypothetical protein
MKFTPGTWSFDRGMYGNGRRYASIFSEEEDIVIAEFNELSEFNPGQGTANAHLLSASPEMYKALLKAVQLTSILTDWNVHEVEIDGIMVDTSELGEIFGAAIAKADGKNHTEKT